MSQIINLRKESSKTEELEETKYESNIKLLLDVSPNKLNYSIEEVAGLFGVSYDLIRKSIKEDKIKALRFGARYVIHIHEVARLLTEGLLWLK